MEGGRDLLLSGAKIFLLGTIFFFVQGSGGWVSLAVCLPTMPSLPTHMNMTHNSHTHTHLMLTNTNVCSEAQRHFISLSHTQAKTHTTLYAPLSLTVFI